MRHNKKYNSLGRKSQHRKLMLSNMACSLIKYKRISTTVAKAKALRIFFEPIVTKAKVDNTANRREAFAKLRDKEAVKELFHDVITKVGDRQGGYTRILKTGFRLGDAAQMCFIELVDFNENYSSNKTASAAAEPKKKATRRSRAKKSAETVEAEAAPAAEVVEEAKAE
ncbi:MAG: 50S ribosomal protein L17 [Paludibacteraceae bacterium]|jgi:large subunit ribosomal protein L17|nr:50S ribosomal protein L17 [Paludibacteraceae bacterium]